MNLTILGPPRTKKSHNNAFLMKSNSGKGQPCPHCRKPILQVVNPSPAWVEWVKTATVHHSSVERIENGFRGVSGQLVRGKVGGEVVTYSWRPDGSPGRKLVPLAVPVNCAAVFYRDANRGDLFGYLQGLGDFLQKWGIIEDDVLIRTSDGSRLDKDASRPRVEVVLTPLPQPGEPSAPGPSTD